MPIALDPNRQIPYTLKAERGNDAPTVFHLRPLTARQRGAVEDLVTVTRDGDMEPNIGSQRLARVRAGLTGWARLRTADGTEVEFTASRDGGASDAALDRLDPDTLAELAGAIQEISELGRLAVD